LYSINPNIMAWSIIHLPQQIRWMGFILTMVGIIIFTWVLRSLGHNFSTTLTIRSDQTLIKSGPYKWVRHPMYTAFIIIWLGFFFIQ
jgi:protein-S-isoprenylcysteine O-methyltransferase Ste14